MPTTLIYIDSSIYRNRELTKALERKLESKYRFAKAIHRLPHNDSTLIDALQNILEGSGSFCIAASAETYPLAARILATLSGDTLIATGDTLHPSFATEVSEKSFLMKLNGKECNLILLKGSEEIPEILLETGEMQTSWQLFGSREDLEMLKKHALDNQYSFESFRQIEDWYEIVAQSGYHLDRYIDDSDELLLIPSGNIFDTCIEVLGSRGETISFAESCTGGLIASSFTSRSGSSDIIEGTVVSYANEIKHRWLEVDDDILSYPGAVSDECVREMAEGARRLAQSDIALATSGIAGPTGGTPFKPVGTVYIALSTEKETVSRHLLLKGDRNYIQYQAMMYAIKLMIDAKKNIFKEFFKNS